MNPYEISNIWTARGETSESTTNVIWTETISTIDYTIFYYMASPASGQDEPNRALWLATRAGKMEPSCPLGTARCIPHEKFPRKPYNKSFIDQVCSVKMVGYWPRSFFASLWTSTSSRSINTQKKKLANIQPSWPHTWSITHTINNQINARALIGQSALVYQSAGKPMEKSRVLRIII